MKIISFTTLTLFLLLTGCSNEEKNSKELNSSETALASGIEISQNENSQEVKVAERARNGEDKQYYVDYDTKNEPKNENGSSRSVIDANINVRSPYEKIQISMITKQLSTEFIVKCSACHNDYANGIIGPSLLGKDSNYIFNKIQKFKNDRKANILMSDLVTQMSDKEIRKIADEIYSFNKEIKKLRDRK